MTTHERGVSGLLGSLLSWGKPERARIFLSYRRRGEGAGYAARLADRLVNHFGGKQIFRDIEDIESGVDFVDAIGVAVASCEVLIVVIGTDWLRMTDASGARRLDDPRDFVRLEVAAALQRGIRVIPVLVCGATMPPEAELPQNIAALSRRQAHELSDTRWDYDVGQLLTALESVGIRPAGKPRPGPTASSWKKKATLTAVAVFGGLGLLAAIAEYANRSTPDPSGLLYDDAQNAAGSDAAGKPPPAGATESTDAGRSVPRTATPEDAVVQALRAAAQARAFAEETMDPQALARQYTGVALQYRVGQLQYLASQGEFARNELHDLDIASVTLSPDGLSAMVQLEETWSANHYSVATRQCVHRLPTHRVPQTAYLTRLTGTWMVYGIELHSAFQPQAVFCE